MDYPLNLYLHGFNLLPQFGPSRLLKLSGYFKDYQKAFFATETQLLATGLEPEIVRAFLKHRETLDLDKEAAKLKAENIGILTHQDKAYPKLLLEIPKFPPILYFRGKMDEPEELCVAMVGTRNISNYGRTIIPSLVEPLVNNGITIVSGMAFGVDAAAHQVSINKGKRTVAVLGGGLDQKSLYPKYHALLAERILENGGALLSEYPPGTPNFKQNFVARNRIISGMSLATVIVECDLQSGTLITAHHALDQNRTVYAVPGPIYAATSQGPNNLLKMGAKPLTSADDILEDLNLEKLPEQRESQDLFGDTAEEVRLLGILGREPMVIDEIIKLSNLEAGKVRSTLTFLEMKGKVRNLGGQQYILSR